LSFGSFRGCVVRAGACEVPYHSVTPIRYSNITVLLLSMLSKFQNLYLYTLKVLMTTSS